MSMGKRSIREFCELDMPIFMFDKNGDFMVARLGEVCAIFLLFRPSSHALSGDSICDPKVRFDLD